MNENLVDPLFQFHKLNPAGQAAAAGIAKSFTQLLGELAAYGALEGRYGAIVKTHLETACFSAKKSMATLEHNQEPQQPQV